MGAGQLLSGLTAGPSADVPASLSPLSRVKVLAVAHSSHQLFSTARVLYIDVGRTEEVKSYQILELPQRYHDLPGQAVEMVVCCVRPADGEKDWHPKVCGCFTHTLSPCARLICLCNPNQATRAIRQKIQGVQHQARVVLSLGNTLFLDPMVPALHQRLRTPGQTSINGSPLVP